MDHACAQLKGGALSTGACGVRSTGVLMCVQQSALRSGVAGAAYGALRSRLTRYG
jgi:hypothetical protein